MRVADLVLTADREQRTSIAGLADGAAGRTFTLLEFVSLGMAVCEQEGSAGPVELVLTAARSRGPASNDPVHDLPDPIFGGAERHASVFTKVAEASVTLARLLHTG